MVHTYEVMVDLKEYADQAAAYRSDTARYEIDAESRQSADTMARIQARNDFPSCSEYDIRVTRLLR